MLVGLIGKPSTGKSTFFKACTLAEVAIANYPFTTIEPNEGVGYVKVDCIDKEFNRQCNPRVGFCINHKRFVPVKLIDVAGLVPGSYEGKGMGNQFLDDLNQADVLIHIVDASGSTNEKGEVVEIGTYNPINDIKFLENELDQWFLRIFKKGWDKFARQIRGEKLKIEFAVAKQMSGLKVTEDIASEVLKKIDLDKDVLKWNEKDILKLCSELRKRTKPIVIAANKVDLTDKFVKELEKHNIIPCSAEAELALREAAKDNLIDYIPGENNFSIKGKINDKQKKALEYIKKTVLDKYGNTGVQNILDYAVFNLLDYLAIFPGGINKLEDSEGRVLPDCFLLKNGSTALDFAYTIHTDLGENFIRAIDVRTKRVIGREHKLKNRDVIEIITK